MSLMGGHLITSTQLSCSLLATMVIGACVHMDKSKPPWNVKLIRGQLSRTAFV